MRNLVGIKNSSLIWGPRLCPFKIGNRRSKEQKWDEGQGIGGFECVKSFIIIYQTYIEHMVGHWGFKNERPGP